MHHFSQLISDLDQSNKTKDKVAALIHFFQHAEDTDKVWAIALFTHRRPKRVITTKQLREWSIELSNTPDWLFEESYHTVGDLAETISLLLPQASRISDLSLSEWIEKLKSLVDKNEDEKKLFILDAWSRLSKNECFIFNKIITGGFRIGVSQNLITQALSEHLDMEKSTVAHCLMGIWQPEKISFDELLSSNSSEKDISKPYPFFLAHPLEKNLHVSLHTESNHSETKWTQCSFFHD